MTPAEVERIARDIAQQEVSRAIAAHTREGLLASVVGAVVVGMLGWMAGLGW